MKALMVAVLLTFVALTSMAQPVKPGDIVVYERVTKPAEGEKGTFVWSGPPAQEEIKVVRSESEVLIWESGGKFTYFSPVSFAMSNLQTSEVSSDFKLETDKKGEGFPAGAQWRYTVVRNYFESKTCSGTLRNDVVSVSNGDTTVNGAKTVGVSQSGDYSSCVGSGTFKRSFLYSTELKVPVLMETVTYYQGKVWSGSRMVLKEIRRAP